MIKVRLLLLIPSLFLSSCMSIATLTEETSKKFDEPDNCPEDCTVHRVYSGVSVDMCILRTDDSGQGGAIAFWDLPFSFVLDTLVLPYTIYKQVSEGGSFSEPIGAESNCK